MYKELIFDFDGTISDTYPVFTEALLVLLERHGLSDSYEHAYMLLKKSVGHALGNYDFKKSAVDISREFHSIHDAMALDIQKPFSDAAATLEALTGLENNCRCYIYTHTGKLVYRLLDKWDLSKYITDSVDGSMKFPRKPSPDALNYLIKKNCINKSNAMMIGDRDIDIDVGHNAGIEGCLFDSEGYYGKTMADYNIACLSELVGIVNSRA